MMNEKIVKRLHRLLRSQGVPEQYVQDLAQQALFKYSQCQSTVTEPYSWMTRVALNEWYDELRKKQTRERHAQKLASWYELSHEAEPMTDSVLADHVSCLYDCVRETKGSELLLDRLNHELMGKTAVESQDASARKQLSRARKRVKDKLTACCPDILSGAPCY